MKTLIEYIYEVSDKLLDNAAKIANKKSEDKNLSKIERGYRANQAKEFTNYKNSKCPLYQNWDPINKKFKQGYCIILDFKNFYNLIDEKYWGKTVYNYIEDKLTEYANNPKNIVTFCPSKSPDELKKYDRHYLEMAGCGVGVYVKTGFMNDHKETDIYITSSEQLTNEYWKKKDWIPHYLCNK